MIKFKKILSLLSLAIFVAEFMQMSPKMCFLSNHLKLLTHPLNPNMFKDFNNPNKENNWSLKTDDGNQTNGRHFQ